MKLSRKLIVFAVVAVLLVPCFVVYSSADFSLSTVGTRYNINSQVSYQRYTMVSGVNGGSNSCAAITFSPDEYIPIPFAAYAGTSANLQNQVKIAQEKYGYEVAAAINGTFFSMDTAGDGSYGTLVNSVITNGKVMSSHQGDNFTAAVFDSDGTFHSVSTSLTYGLTINDSVVPDGLYYINKTSGTKSSARWGNGIYYWDTACGTRIDSNPNVTGYVVLCRKVDNTDLVIGGTLKAEVISVTADTADGTVSADTFVLFTKTTSTNAKYLKDLQAGDKVEITVNEGIAASRSVTQNANGLMANIGWLIKDGVDRTRIDSTIGTHSVTYATRWCAIGMKPDGSYVFFVSDGTGTLRDVADVFKQLGCNNAIRMDGGGSSSMYTTNLAGSGNGGYIISSSRSLADCVLIVKKSSACDDNLTNALRTAANNAKTDPKASDKNVQTVLAEIDAFFANNTYYVKGDVRRLLMKLQEALSVKEALAKALSDASYVKATDYSEYSLENLQTVAQAGYQVLNDSNVTVAQVQTATNNVRYWLGQIGSGFVNVSFGKSYTRTAPNYTYVSGDKDRGKDDGIRLTDGQKNSLAGDTAVYSAWKANPVIVTVDLGSVQEVNQFKVHAAQQTDWGISCPSSFKMSVSADGSSFTDVGTSSAGVLVDGNANNGWSAWTLTLTQNATGRYFRFTVNTVGLFVWLDEVEIFKNLAPITDVVYINGINRKVTSNDGIIFTSEAGNLSSDSVNAKWTRNVFLIYNAAAGGWVVTSNAPAGGVSPDRTLTGNELLLAIHADDGNSAGKPNFDLAATFEEGDILEIHGYLNAYAAVAGCYVTKVGHYDPSSQGDGKPGDVSGDEQLTATDYLMVKRAVLGSYTLTEEQNVIADVSGDKQVTATDYLMIKRHVLGSYTIPGWER